MTSTDRKSSARAYMAQHGVNYTTALRAVGPVGKLAEPLLFALVRPGECVEDSQIENTALCASLEEAKAAREEDGNFIYSGFMASDHKGGPQQRHSYPYGNALMFGGGVWGLEWTWGSMPEQQVGWTPAWFDKFPTPVSAVKAPGPKNGDVAFRHEIEGFRFVTPGGSLVTRLLPLLSEEATLVRFTGERQQQRHRDEMERITATFDQELGIRLKEARTEHGRVQYWEFETPDLSSFISWSSLDRRQIPQLEALSGWACDVLSFSSSLNHVPLESLETCESCEEVVTRSHPLARGSMVSRDPNDSESCTVLETPISKKLDSMTWDDLLLLHIFGSFEAANHDGCKEYWG